MRIGPLPALVVVALLPASLGAQDSGAVSGRVTDADSGLAVRDVVVLIDNVGVALTDEDGLFRIVEVPTGANVLVLEHLGYGRHEQTISVEADRETVVAIAVTVEAIELTPIVVETLSELEERRLTSGSSINEVGAAEIDAAARAGLNLGDLIQSALPGVDVRQGRTGMCVTYRPIRSGNDRGDCDGVSVRLDGVPVSDPASIYATIPLTDIERVEVLSPGQAGVRYGMRSGQGVLLIETKRGEGRRPNELGRYLNGFGWEGESQPYRWGRVAAGAAVTNAATVGLMLMFADHCFWTPEANPLALRTACGPLGTTGASVLSVVVPAVAGTLVTRWAGQTDRSRGRAVPSMVAAAMMLTGGYLMVIGGEGRTRVGGAVVLSVGVPLSQILTDRGLRILR